MKLYILASGKDAKGTQLEYLTKIILESLGYEYVATNVIASGGDEIDVFGKRVFQSVNGLMVYPLVCECKAHEAPINMNDWEKFMGKVYMQRKKNSLTQGLMIALSGANGNVKGNYEQSNYDEVTLLQGTDLIQPLMKTFALEEESIAREEVSHLTNQTVVSVDLVLFEKEIYWLFAFANGEYSLFDKKYQSLSPDLEAKFLPLLAQHSQFETSKYKNVRHEFDLVRRRSYVEKVICWHLMKGKMNFQDAINDVVYMTGANIIPDLKDVEEVMPTIPFANVDAASQTATLKNDDEIDYLVFYRYLLNGPLPLPIFLYDDYYQRHIDIALLEKIQHLHHGLTLAEEDKQDCLFILRHSPSALFYALMPNKMLKAAVIIGKSGENNVAINHFKGELLAHLEADTNVNGSKVTFDILGLRDFNKTLSVSLVDKDGEKREISAEKRIFVVQTSQDNIDFFQAFGDFDKEYEEIKKEHTSQSRG